MRVLLTGGTGFIGKHLVRRLVERGDDVLLLTRGEADSITAGVQIHNLGRTSWTEAELSRVIARFCPDSLIHLAGVIHSSSLQSLYETNVILADRLISAASRVTPSARILMIGSAAEYGPPSNEQGKAREYDHPRPVSPYGISKLAQTLHAMYRADAGCQVTVARLFNPVGPQMPEGLLFSDVAAQLATGASQVVIGDTRTVRDFMPIDEACRIILSLVESPAAVGKVVNVCSGVPQRVEEGVDHLLSASGRKVDLVQKPYMRKIPSVQVIYGDTELLRSLGIRPASANIKGELDALLLETQVRLRTRR